METNPKAKSKTDAPEQLREMAEKGFAQSKEVFEKMSAASGQAADVVQHCYSSAVKGMQDYNNSRQHQGRLRFCPKDVWRKVAVGVRRTFDRACTAAAYDTDRADQATRGACPAGDVRDCGAAEDTAGAVVDLRFITGAK